jgi:energy-coupling factor transporter ATP-binding protein EcfA2
VGGELIKGISGGERKRTSVGVELVTKPALVFLDEPTSGLDSFSAVQLCQVLKKVANAGASVLFTIHQPSSEIFNSFDRLILMNKGRVMFQGPVGQVPDYFSDHGFPSPPNYNPADWVMVSLMWYKNTARVLLVVRRSWDIPQIVFLLFFVTNRTWHKAILWMSWMLRGCSPKVRLLVENENKILILITSCMLISPLLLLLLSRSI